MVLFDESPVSLIRETTNQFHITPDKDSITRIHHSLNTLHAARQSRLDSHHQTLKSLSRRLNSLKGQVEYEESRHDAGGHAAEVLRLDTEKFKIAKGVSDLEVVGERLVGELAGLRVQLEQLEREGVEGGRRNGADGDDEVLLKLNLYRSLGIDVVQDENTAEFNRAIVHNTTEGDVNIINVDGKMSRTFYANTLWSSV